MRTEIVSIQSLGNIKSDSLIIFDYAVLKILHITKHFFTVLKDTNTQKTIPTRQINFQFNLIK